MPRSICLFRASVVGRWGVVLVVVLALLGVGCRTSGQARVAGLVDQSRAEHGLDALEAQDQLDDKAQAWAERLAQGGDLRHSDLSDSIDGYWEALGENVGYGGSVDDVHDRYLASPPHRANVLDAQFDRIGTGVSHRADHTYTVHVFLRSC